MLLKFCGIPTTLCRKILHWLPSAPRTSHTYCLSMLEGFTFLCSSKKLVSLPYPIISHLNMLNLFLALFATWHPSCFLISELCLSHTGDFSLLCFVWLLEGFFCVEGFFGFFFLDFGFIDIVGMYKKLKKKNPPSVWFTVNQICALQNVCLFNVALLSTFMKEITHLPWRDSFDMYHWSF